MPAYTREEEHPLLTSPNPSKKKPRVAVEKPRISSKRAKSPSFRRKEVSQERGRKSVSGMRDEKKKGSQTKRVAEGKRPALLTAGIGKKRVFGTEMYSLRLRGEFALLKGGYNSSFKGDCKEFASRAYFHSNRSVMGPARTLKRKRNMLKGDTVESRMLPKEGLNGIKIIP